MVNVEKVYHALLANGIDFFTGVPDFLLKDIFYYISDKKLWVYQTLVHHSNLLFNKK